MRLVNVPRLMAVLCFAGSTVAVAEVAETGTPVETRDVDEIIVVAHKHPRSRKDVAANVTVLTLQDAQLELGNSVAEAFRYVPGIEFESAGTRFGPESINIRGISGNRVAIRLDGVPLSDQFDVGRFSNATRDLVDSGFVRQIEILHGPASALYGSDAIGGVVAMRTIAAGDIGLAPGQGGTITSRFDGASAGLNLTGLQALEVGNFSVIAGISLSSGEEADAAAADQNLDRRNYSGRSALLNLGYNDSRGDSWHARFYRQDDAVESALASMLGTGRFRSTTALEGDDELRGEIASLEYDASDVAGIDRIVLRAYHQASEARQRTYDERGLARRPVAIDRVFSFEQMSQGLEANFQASFLTGDVAHELGFGFEYRRRKTEEFRDGTETGLVDGEVNKAVLGELFPLRDFPVSQTRDWGGYLEETMSIGRWSLIAAIRADRYDMQPQVDALFGERYPFADAVSISASEVSPKLGLVVRLSAATEIYAQYAHGFRAPPYEDANIGLDIPLFNVRAIPNPDLRAERSDGIDLGFRWRGGTGGAHLSVFRTEYRDFIESRVRLGVDPESGRLLFQSQNIDRAIIEGVEAGWSLDLVGLLAGLTFDGSLFVARGKDRQSGEPLNSVGPPQAVLGLDWISPGERWTARLRGTFTGSWSERDESSGDLFEPPGHAVFDAYTAYRVSQKVTVRAGLRNLTDRTYWSWASIRGLGPEDPTLPYLSQAGRHATVGVDIQW